MADMNLTTAIVIFHFSGVVGCETLLWIILPVFWKWYIINLFLLLVTSFCFFNTIRRSIAKLLPTHSSAAQPPNPEPQELSQPDLIIGLSLFLMSMKNLYFIARVLKNGSLTHVLFVEFSSPRAILCTCFSCIPGEMIRFAGLIASNVLCNVSLH
ncbi:hypothetical protein QL285_060690 [Trifolium repens]|nr:hypothetical protein QL285_060690 [Trifolium repens]